MFASATVFAIIVLLCEKNEIIWKKWNEILLFPLVVGVCPSLIFFLQIVLSMLFLVTGTFYSGTSYDQYLEEDDSS